MAREQQRQQQRQQQRPQQQQSTQQQDNSLQAALTRLRDQLKVHEGDIAAMIQGMTVDQFFGLIKRACIANPDILRADRLSLIQAALDCANDGLKPDGREGAFVCFNTRVMENGAWVSIVKVQWMPMIRGIIKKILNVGTVKSVKAEPVYTRDHFERWADDDGEHINFRPARGDRGEIESYFAAIWMKDSVVFVEEMTLDEINQVKASSKSAGNEDGPWKKWEGEMSKKTTIKRLAKRVPLSSEVERLFARDDERHVAMMRDITPEQETARPKGIANRLDALADNRGMGGMPDLGAGRADDRETVNRGSDQQQGQTRQGSQERPAPANETPPEDVEGAYDLGVADKAAGKVSLSMPKAYKQDGNEKLMEAWQRGYRGESMPSEDEDEASKEQDNNG